MLRSSQIAIDLSFHPSGAYLYATGTVVDSHIHAFQVKSEGDLRYLNRQLTNGQDPCYLSIEWPQSTRQLAGGVNAEKCERKGVSFELR